MSSTLMQRHHEVDRNEVRELVLRGEFKPQWGLTYFKWSACPCRTSSPRQPPAVRSTRKASSTAPSLTELSTFLDAERTVPFMDQLWLNPKVQQIMLSGIEEVFSGQDADYRSCG